MGILLIILLIIGIGALLSIAVSLYFIVREIMEQTCLMKEMLLLQQSFHSMHFHESELTKQYLKCKIKEAENEKKNQNA